ncbi:SET and MYND domain-containing protein 5 [Bagarius yarrelli]|uniref:SET and MYND domain-containing protein 5 n=1 Tax=Bagarius yarrelli TaxID=175774 RepID=A0A556UZU2_BAGYA|nr:SET and MYND domain-containing protein 5 [Bagarius yarrelli]
MAAPVDDMFSRCVDPSKASNCVEVRFIDNVKGKGLFAKRAFKKGETIFTERPLVSAQFLWNAMYKYKACEYCLRALETAEENARRLSGLPALNLPHPELCKVRPELHQACPSCQVMYCSSECRQAAWDQYHKVLCLGPSHHDPNHPINKLQDAWRSAHYPPETSSIMLMAKMVAVFKQWFTPDGFRSLFALVGTNGQGIGTRNGRLPQLRRLRSLSSPELICIPNAEASFPDNNFLLHLSTLTDISPGEEICISYLDCCQRDRSRHSRHKILRENYLFVCSCQKCMAQLDDADMTSEDEDEGEGETEGDDLEDEMTDV